MSVPDRLAPVQAFVAAAGRGRTTTLLDAAAAVAAAGQDAFDAAAMEATLDALTAGMVAEGEIPADPAAAADRLCGYLRDRCGFVGAPEHYGEPAHSFIDRVLATKRGLPITYAVLYVELGRRVGLDCEGVNFPGHFLVRLRGGAGRGRDGSAILIDPFVGRSLSHQACAALLRRQQGPTAALGPQHLLAASPRQVLLRMCNNLKQGALASGALIEGLFWSDCLLLAEPGLVLEHRDRALLLERLGDLDGAVESLRLLEAGASEPGLQRRVRARREALERRRGQRTLH
ncbi:MAG: transglutaminase-like domain-containing protein [Pseudomonadales bacterium]|nr:transglutaminase-like domain-containing protein [Pseudomonadales bacterium]